MLFVGYLYGIRSERRLEEEINYNMAYKHNIVVNVRLPSANVNDAESVAQIRKDIEK